MATGAKKRPSAITKLSETPSIGMKNWLIYGKSGDGKTVLAGTAPNALFLTVEAAGTESAKAMGSDADEMVTDTVDTLNEAYDYFKSGSGCKDYEWVILDSLTEVEELFWSAVQGSNNSKKIQDYGTIATLMKKEVDRWNRLPINVLYTAHTMALGTEDEDGDEAILTLPGMGTKNGSLSQKVCAKTTLNGYLIVKTAVNEDGERLEQRRLMLRGNDAFIAKDRHLICPSKGYIVDADIASMAEAADRAATGSTKKKKAAKSAAATEEE